MESRDYLGTFSSIGLKSKLRENRTTEYISLFDSDAKYIIFG